MKVNFYTRDKKNNMCSIHYYCVFCSERVRLSTKIDIPSHLWDEKKQRVITSKAKDMFSDVNRRLQGIEDSCYAVYNSLIKEGKFSMANFRARLSKLVEGKASTEDLVCPYYEHWANETTPQRKASRGKVLCYRNFLAYAGATITFNEITYSFIEKFLKHLSDKGYSLNYIGTNLKNLKAVMNDANKKGLHSNMAYKMFAKMEEDSDTTYLTKEEMQRIKDVAGLTTPQEKARDLFLVGYYTAMRYSDYSRLSLSDLKDGMIYKFRTLKTGAVVSIPAHPDLVEILRKYGGAPNISEQKLNLLIKTVCNLAEINDIISKTTTKGGKRQTVYYSKYELVSSHTARRSGATNMYLSGIPKHQIMMITGHTSEKIFNRYIRLTDVENAEMLKTNTFFND